MNTAAKQLPFSRKSLAQQIEERDRSMKETGHYCGMTELVMKEKDATRFSTFVSRMFTAAISSREMCKYISASPAARQMGEEIFAVLTAEGDVIAMSMGMQAHVSMFHTLIRAMVDRGFEDDPGIKDGDIFECNDPKYAGLHPADVYTVVPMFWRGELIGWTGGLNHVPDIGTMYPHTNSDLSPTIFTDGFVNPPWRVGENFKHYPWFYDLWERRTRTGIFNVLDAKMRLAGCLTLQKRVLGIIEEFGLEYYQRASKELIEDGRQVAEATIKRSLVPGVYRDPWLYLLRQKGMLPWFSAADRNFLLHAPARFRITADLKLVADLRGASTQGYHSFHAFPYGAPWAVMFKAVRDRLCYDPKVSAGMTSIIQVEASKGSIYNPDSPTTATSAATLVSTAVTMQNYACCQGRSWFARGFLEESQGMASGGTLPAGWGTLDDGSTYAYVMFEVANQLAGCALACADGEPSVYAQAADECDSADAEELATTLPSLFYLYRGLEPNACGHGKFRGGLSTTQNMVVMERGKAVRVNCVSNGVSDMGGHYTNGSPGGSNIAIHLKDTNFHELVKKGIPFPRSWHETRSYLDKGLLTARAMVVGKSGMKEDDANEGDLVFFIHGGGIGWGDPIERDPQLLVRDVESGDLTLDVVESIYGVLLEDVNGNLVVNQAATDKARASIRQQRKKASLPFKQWWKSERQKVLNKDFGTQEEVLEMHRDSLRWPETQAEFTGFWQVGKDFSI